MNKNPINAEVKQINDDGKYLIQYGGGDHTTLTTYNHVVDVINKRLDKDEEGYWSFEEILNHRLNRKKKYELLIIWSSGEETWKSLTNIGETDPISCAKYGHDNHLLEYPQWKRFKPFVGKIKHINHLWNMIHQASQRHAKRYKFVLEIPRN